MGMENYTLLDFFASLNGRYLGLYGGCVVILFFMQRLILFGCQKEKRKEKKKTSRNNGQLYPVEQLHNVI